MKRSYRRARKGYKKSFKKKRIYKSWKKSAKGKFNTVADAGYFEKLTKQADFTVDASTNFAQMIVNWTATGASGNSEIFFTGSGASASQQFTQMQGAWREYKITSLKISYRPFIIQAANDVMIKPIESGTVMNNLLPMPIDGTQYKAQLDSKNFDPTRPFKRFYRVSKWAKTRVHEGQQWRLTNVATAAPAPGSQVGGYNGLYNCQTVFNVDCTGLAAGFQFGSFKVTYYMKFRIRQRGEN